MSQAELLDQIKRLFKYERWATRETTAGIRAAGAPTDRATRLMAHIVAAKWLWLDRIRPGIRSLAVWPDFSFDELETEAELSDDAWRRYLDSIDHETLREEISYTNSKGEPWSSPLIDVFIHVVVHSAYHRGQVAAELRASGHAPPNTDFVHAARRGFLIGGLKMAAETITIYQKPTCSTCRKTMQILKDAGVDFEAVNYYTDPIPKKKLKELLSKMKLSAREVLRTKEPIYKELSLGSRDLSEDQLIDLMVKHPDLMQRPVVERGKRAVLARPPERINEIL